MADVADVTGIGSLLDAAGVGNDRNDFEAMYSALVANGSKQDVVAQIEDRIFEYFAALELPEEPTLYDYIVLSLREKDVVATFNWDPFLVQAVLRNQHVGGTPRTFFLHGNVAIGYCARHQPTLQTRRDTRCPKCNSQLLTSPLLYPVKEKNYQEDTLINTSWRLVQQELTAGYLLTVFGYSAPSTDVEAVNLLQASWDPDHSQQFKTMEIVDIRSEDELRSTWRPFFPATYYSFHREFRDSLLARYPRRSCESRLGTDLNGHKYAEQIGEYVIPEGTNWSELHDWFAPLIKAEHRIIPPTR